MLLAQYEQMLCDEGLVDNELDDGLVSYESGLEIG